MVKKILYALAFLLLFSCKSQYEVVNKGIAGNNSSQLVQRVQKDVIDENPDLVLIMVGTNDMINSKKFVSYADYIKNLSVLVAQISKRKKIDIALLNVLPVDEDYVFNRHDRNLFEQSPNLKIDSLNNLLKDFAIQNKLEYFDVNSQFRNEGMSFKEANSLLINSKNDHLDDGVHPTAYGYKRLGEYVFEQLKQRGLLKKNRRILCFGDSITYGAFMEGKGTHTGNTYPSVLLKLLRAG